MRLKGIRPLPSGHLRAYLRCHGTYRSKVFPETTALETIQAWRMRERLRILEQHPRAPRPADESTVALDAQTYLAAVAAMPTISDRMRDIGYWIQRFGDRPRPTITAAEIRAALAEWRSLGAAAATCNHRRTALMHFFSVLDGKAAPNPVRDVPKLPEPDPAPRDLPPGVVRAILAACAPGRTQIRLRVMATTGLPPASLRRLKPGHLDLAHRRVWIEGRRKGAGTKGRWLPLTHAAIAAFNVFVRRDCFGDFSRGTMRRLFREACQAVMARARAKRKPIPDLSRARPYDLRHSLLTRAYAVTGDIRAVQELAGHSDPRMTARYAQGAVSGRALAAVKALNRRR